MRREGLRFFYTAFDGGYGHLPWLLTALDDEGELFLAEVHFHNRHRRRQDAMDSA